MPAAVRADELRTTFDFVSAGMRGENAASISLDTGKIYWTSSSGDLPEDQEVPDDIDDSDRYIEVPHKNDLNLGRRLVMDFADRHMPADSERIEGFFRRRGAYGRFKDLLFERDMLAAWHAFEAQATEQALREWCEENEIQLVGDAPAAAATPSSSAPGVRNTQINPAAITRLHRPAGIPFHIGKIGHVALHVRDLEQAARFYTQVLGFQVSDAYGNDMLPGGVVFLRCNTDHHGIALFPAEADRPADAGLHHVAFEVATLEEVVRARDHLRHHQVSIDFEGRRRAGCQIAVEFRDPDGHSLEIYWNIDQIGSDGRARPANEWKGAPSLEAAIADPVVGQDTARFTR